MCGGKIERGANLGLILVEKVESMQYCPITVLGKIINNFSEQTSCTSMVNPFRLPVSRCSL